MTPVAPERTPSLSPRPSLTISHLGGVMGQMRLINGIFAALSSSIAIADLHLMILTILTTPRGLGFTRARLFTAGDRPALFTGALALGCESAHGLQDLELEIHTEEALLASMAADERGRRGGAGAQELDELRNQTWWITAYQRAQPDNPLSRAVQGRPLFRARLRSLPASLEGPGEIRVLHGRQPAPPKSLDPDTAALLGEEWLLGALRTKRGVRAFVAVDKAFQPGGLTRDDATNFEWLLNQASLALENAELYDDLRRAYTEIQEVDRMKSNFLSTISHELRTPLTSILGFVQLMANGRTGPVNDEQQRLLEKVVDKSRDLQSLVNDILEVAEIQAGGLVRLDPEPVALEDVIDHVIARVVQRRRAPHVTVEHRRPAQPLPPVLGERQALERIFYHLIDNAVKFIPQAGRVTVRHRVTRRTVQTSITDTGIGMAPQHLEKIFEHFYQIDSDLNRTFNGVGLGLTITKKLVNLLGAKIEVQSTPGKGSTFCVSLRIAPVDEASGGAGI